MQKTQSNTNKQTTIKHTTKSNVVLTAVGKKFNNFNVINNKNAAKKTTHLNKLNTASKQSYTNFFNAISKALNLQHNIASSYVNYKFISKVQNINVNVQFWCSANKYLLCVQVKQNMLKKLQAYVIASKIFTTANNKKNCKLIQCFFMYKK
jgi:hypothetical protein